MAFYKSPIGKSFLQKMPLVMQLSVSVIMGLMTDVQAEVKKIMEETKQKPE